MKRRMLRPLLLIIVLSLSLTACTSSARKEEYNYMTAEELKTKLENSEEVLILDLQSQEDFDKHHILGAIPSYAYPVETDADKARIDDLLPLFEGSDGALVIICPRGGEVAERAYDYLLEKGIADSRVFILEKGQEAWPYDDLLE